MRIDTVFIAELGCLKGNLGELSIIALCSSLIEKGSLAHEFTGDPIHCRIYQAHTPAAAAVAHIFLHLVRV